MAENAQTLTRKEAQPAPVTGRADKSNGSDRRRRRAKRFWRWLCVGPKRTLRQRHCAVLERIAPRDTSLSCPTNTTGMFAGPLGRSTFTPPKSSFDSPLYGLVSLRRSQPRPEQERVPTQLQVSTRLNAVALVSCDPGLVYIVMVLACAVYGTTLESAQKTDSIGEWRDYVGDFWDHNLRIVQEDNRYVMVVRPTRGKPFRQELTELPARGVRRFKVDGDDDIYVIQADGDLGLYDSEGLIRVAKKVE